MPPSSHTGCSDRNISLRLSAPVLYEERMGHRSRSAGEEFENRIGNALEVALQTGIIAWYAHQEPRKTMAGRPIAQSGADWIFILSGSSMAGAIECKSALQGTRPTGDRIARSAFSPEQQNHLAAVSRSGGLALAALEFRDEKAGVMSGFLVPWHEVRWKRLDKLEHVFLSDVDPKWKIGPTKTIERFVRKCVDCGAYHPIAEANRFSSCCFGGGMPF